MSCHPDNFTSVMCPAPSAFISSGPWLNLKRLRPESLFNS